VLSAQSTTRAWQLRERGQRFRAILHRLQLRPAGVGKSGKGVPHPRVVASDLSSRGPAKPAGFVGGPFYSRDRPICTSDRHSPKRHRGGSRPGASVCQSCAELRPDRPLRRSGEHTSTCLRAQAGHAQCPGHPIQHRAAAGRPKERDRVVGLAGERPAWNMGWLTPRLSHSLEPAACRPPARLRGGRSTWPCKRVDARRLRVTGPPGRLWEAACGNGAEANTNATAALDLSNGRDVEYAAGLALALSGESSRSQLLADDWNGASRKIPSPNSPTCRSFARSRHSITESLQTAWSDCRSRLPYEPAVTGLNFNHFYLGGLHSAYVRGEALLAAQRYAEAAAEFQKILDHRGIVGADPIGALAHLQLGRIRSSCRATRPGRRPPTRIS